MQVTRDRQKSYANLKRKPMEFQFGDKVMLKVSPWKGVVRFGKRGKLNPRYVGPFKVLEKVGSVAYKLELPEELSEAMSRLSKFDGTLGEALSLHGNAKINSGRNIHTSSQRPHRRQVSRGLKFVIHIEEITISELRKKLEIVQKEKDGIQLNVDKFEHASKSLNKLIECQIDDNCKKGLGYENYNAVPPPYTGDFMPPTPDLTFTGLDEFVNEPVVENCKAMSSKEEPKVVRKYDDAPSIEEWVSDDEEEDVSSKPIFLRKFS
ncbi:hypothetical protein Tco_0738355 [Tanacetum coccineum]